jgi:hypothetical protein
MCRPLQYLEISTHQKQEIINTARCLGTAFYILTFYVLILHMYTQWVSETCKSVKTSFVQ